MHEWTRKCIQLIQGAAVQILAVHGNANFDKHTGLVCTTHSCRRSIDPQLPALIPSFILSCGDECQEEGPKDVGDMAPR